RPASASGGPDAASIRGARARAARVLERRDRPAARDQPRRRKVPRERDPREARGLEPRRGGPLGGPARGAAGDAVGEAGARRRLAARSSSARPRAMPAPPCPAGRSSLWLRLGASGGRGMIIPSVIETSPRGERAFDIYSLLLRERIV